MCVVISNKKFHVNNPENNSTKYNFFQQEKYNDKSEELFDMPYMSISTEDTAMFKVSESIKFKITSPYLNHPFEIFQIYYVCTTVRKKQCMCMTGWNYIPLSGRISMSLVLPNTSDTETVLYLKHIKR